MRCSLNNWNSYNSDSVDVEAAKKFHSFCMSFSYHLRPSPPGTSWWFVLRSWYLTLYAKFIELFTICTVAFYKNEIFNLEWIWWLLLSFIDFVFYSVIICDLSLQELPDDCTRGVDIDIKHKVYKTYYL